MPLNKIPKIHMLTIRSVFAKDGKYYSKGFSDDCL